MARTTAATTAAKVQQTTLRTIVLGQFQTSYLCRVEFNASFNNSVCSFALNSTKHKYDAFAKTGLMRRWTHNATLHAT